MLKRFQAQGEETAARAPSTPSRHRSLPLTIHTPLHACTDSVSPPAIRDQARLSHQVKLPARAAYCERRGRRMHRYDPESSSYASFTTFLTLASHSWPPTGTHWLAQRSSARVRHLSRAPNQVLLRPFSTSPRRLSLAARSSSAGHGRSTRRLRAVYKGALPSQQQSPARPSLGSSTLPRHDFTRVQHPGRLIWAHLREFYPYFIKNMIINKNFGFTHQRERGGTQQESVVIVVVVDKQHMYIRRESAIDWRLLGGGASQVYAARPASRSSTGWRNRRWQRRS